MSDVIIVGAGTAGLSAAIYAARAGKSVLVLEERMYGGQIVDSPNVENYPGIRSISGYDFAMSLFEQAVSHGAEVDFKCVTEIIDKGDKKIVIADGQELECKSVILAVGAKAKRLGIPGEEAYIGKGISYCATCDGAFFKDKKVAVIGGGNTALLDAWYLSSYCEEVYVIHRRDEFRADAAAVQKIKEKENIICIMNANVVELLGDEMLSGIVVEDKNSKERNSISVSGVFVAIGHKPNTDGFKGIVDLDEYGYIVADESLETNIPGVYAAGDCRTKELRQLTTAAADGAIAGEKA